MGEVASLMGMRFCAFRSAADESELPSHHVMPKAPSLNVAKRHTRDSHVSERMLVGRQPPPTWGGIEPCGRRPRRSPLSTPHLHTHRVSGGEVDGTLDSLPSAVMGSRRPDWTPGVSRVASSAQVHPNWCRSHQPIRRNSGNRRSAAKSILLDRPSFQRRCPPYSALAS